MASDVLNNPDSSAGASNSDSNIPVPQVSQGVADFDSGTMLENVTLNIPSVNFQSYSRTFVIFFLRIMLSYG